MTLISPTSAPNALSRSHQHVTVLYTLASRVKRRNCAKKICKSKLEVKWPCASQRGALRHRHGQCVLIRPKPDVSREGLGDPHLLPGRVMSRMGASLRHILTRDKECPPLVLAEMCSLWRSRCSNHFCPNIVCSIWYTNTPRVCYRHRLKNVRSVGSGYPGVMVRSNRGTPG